MADDKRPEVEWAVRVDNAERTPGAWSAWTSEPYYRRDHAEDEAKRHGGAYVVRREILAGQWERVTEEGGHG